jgi:hypothetical protein
MHGLHWGFSFYVFRTISARTQLTTTLAPGVSFWMHLQFVNAIYRSLAPLQWIRPMAKWHPVRSDASDDEFRCEFTIILLDSEPPSEGLNEGLVENAPEMFWPCSRDFRAIENRLLDREECQIQQDMCNKLNIGRVYSEIQTQKAYTSTVASPRLSKRGFKDLFSKNNNRTTNSKSVSN